MFTQRVAIHLWDPPMIGASIIEAGGLLHPRLLRHAGDPGLAGLHEVCAPFPRGGAAAHGRTVPPVPRSET